MNDGPPPAAGYFDRFLNEKYDVQFITRGSDAFKTLDAQSLVDIHSGFRIQFSLGC
jgi:hypothetical protein